MPFPKTQTKTQPNQHTVANHNTAPKKGDRVLVEKGFPGEIEIYDEFYGTILQVKGSKEYPYYLVRLDKELYGYKEHFFLHYQLRWADHY